MNDNKINLRPAADDEPVTMTAAERSVWVYLVVSVAGAIVYGSIVIPRALSTPIAEVSWVPPLLWTLGGVIVGMIVGSIVAAIIAAIGLAARGREPNVELEEDERDKAITRRGNSVTGVVSGIGLGAVLVLAMFEADYFWIGNAVYVFGLIGSFVEVGTKLTAYRRGF